MFKRKKSTVKPDLPKEYVWALEIEGEDHEYKCLVTKDEVITYEDGREHKHLKITDHTCMEGVLQIDCETKLFGDMVPFQLERYIPYIKLDRWVMSDTTREDRLQEQIAIYRKQSKQEVAAGIVMIVVFLLGKLLKISLMEELWMLPIFGVFCMSSAALRMVRLKNELTGMREAQEELENEEKEMKAYLEDKEPVFHKSEEE